MPRIVSLVPSLTELCFDLGRCQVSRHHLLPFSWVVSPLFVCAVQRRSQTISISLMTDHPICAVRDAHMSVRDLVSDARARSARLAVR